MRNRFPFDYYANEKKRTVVTQVEKFKFDDSQPAPKFDRDPKSFNYPIQNQNQNQNQNTSKNQIQNQNPNQSQNQNQNHSARGRFMYNTAEAFLAPHSVDKNDLNDYTKADSSPRLFMSDDQKY